MWNVEGPEQLKDHRHWGDGSLADVILRRRAIPIVPESESNGWGVSEVEAILGSSSRFRPESRRPGKVRSRWGSSTIALSYHAWAFNRECFDNLNQPSLWMSFALCHRPCAILSSKPYDKVYFFIISCIDQNWIFAISHICPCTYIFLIHETLIWWDIHQKRDEWKRNFRKTYLNDKNWYLCKNISKIIKTSQSIL